METSLERKFRFSESLGREIRRLKHGGKKVVFTNGCFDLLHPGHVRYLEKARATGDILIVALNTDASVRRIKGSGRPILQERERAEVLCALSCVDYVTTFDEETPQKLIERLLPDVLVKGGDWALHQIVGREIVEQNGGKVLTIHFERGFSTSDIIRRIRAVTKGSERQ